MQFCLFVCLRSEAVNSSGILSIQMFPKELTEWILRIALIYTFMRVTLMQITLVLPPMRITFVRSAAQKARLFPLSFILHRVTDSNILKSRGQAIMQAQKDAFQHFNIAFLGCLQF